MVTLRVVTGPRASMFGGDAIDLLTDSEYEVAPESSRVGVRFDGAALERRDHGELLSEGLIRGALQVPAAGMPIAMLADTRRPVDIPSSPSSYRNTSRSSVSFARAGASASALAQPNEGESR